MAKSCLVGKKNTSTLFCIVEQHCLSSKPRRQLEGRLQGEAILPFAKLSLPHAWRMFQINVMRWTNRQDETAVASPTRRDGLIKKERTNRKGDLSHSESKRRLDGWQGLPVKLVYLLHEARSLWSQLRFDPKVIRSCGGTDGIHVALTQVEQGHWHGDAGGKMSWTPVLLAALPELR